MSTDGPYPFRAADLEAAPLEHGVRQTLAHYRWWRDTHADEIEAHVSAYTSQWESIADRRRPTARLARRLLPSLRRADRRAQIAREVNYFGVYNLAEIVDGTTIDRITGLVDTHLQRARRLASDLDRSTDVPGLMAVLAAQVPVLWELPEARWLAGRLDRLHRILPEQVVQAGGMGKVCRTIAGVLGIGLFDTRDADDATRRAHLARILPGAYAYGAAYAIVDDTLHDLPRDAIPAPDRERYHRLVLAGLVSGQVTGAAEVPDHPLAEHLHELHGLVLASHPFAEHRLLYRAAEAMYLAQHREVARSDDEVLAAGIEAMYPDIFIKSGMSRVVANLLGRRALPDDFLARCLNTIFLSQLKDDLADRAADAAAGHWTPFTFPADLADANPLRDLFAYDAYAARVVFAGDPAAVEALTYLGAIKLVTHLSSARGHVPELLGRYEATPEVARFLRAAGGAARPVVHAVAPLDMRLKHHAGQLLRARAQTGLDARTFVADRLGYLRDVIDRHRPPDDGRGLTDIVGYAMAAPGKLLRPALTLMLAEALGIAYSSIEPALAATELFHTASLIFDDLPAQDDATVRRGRPTPHTVFAEGSVQLAAISMISTGFGLLATLDRHFPADRVTGVIAYAGRVLGPERLCLGQHLDLRLSGLATPATGPEILEMYRLKTATMIEAALVPLMMLTDRPQPEIDAVTRFAEHAGIVFQLRDDILDATATAEELGKDADNDLGKANVVRAFGLAEARRLLDVHRADAIAALDGLPFATGLFEGIVVHFATRRR